MDGWIDGWIDSDSDDCVLLTSPELKPRVAVSKPKENHRTSKEDVKVVQEGVIATKIASHSSHSLNDCSDSTSHNLYPPNSEWGCALCTFVNCGESPTCDVCGKERPSRSAALK